MRLCSILLVGLLACVMPRHASAEDTASQPASPNTSHGTPHRSMKGSALGSVSSFSLEPVATAEPLIRQASLTVKASAPSTHNGFSEAPLPDDDMDAPKERGNGDDATLKADFFQRNHHQVGDALSGGAAANDQRRGHGSMAAGVAVAIPID
ncbi:hypothetical protein [Asaia krungthepensis]|uniref:Uncharacterized protein n=1 Tax=Asaia krungthepensis NRIC 0535 TaxID=1307925 RepID=A0ABQ0Q2C0_9PROT|nr:hypothetical protein [Asaia krungthepensis]GBQ88008.1 hypothetical protein AA0535_1427 [Asaia krungthepensis NRIC 0535]